MISARGVSRFFGPTKVLDAVSLSVAAGETLGIFGPNGSGKTTLLRVLAGLLRPSRGEVLIDGKPPREARGVIGYLGHQPHVYPHLTARENLDFFARLYRAETTAASSVLEKVGLSRRGDVLVRHLSRGETQRLALARATLHDPEVLLVDEPFAGLDDSSATALPDLLRRPGRSVLVATHDPRGGALVDRAVRLEAGRLT